MNKGVKRLTLSTAHAWQQSPHLYCHPKINSINNFLLLQVTDDFSLSSQAHTTHYYLTHPPPPLDKMAAILADDIFKCIFLNGKIRIPIQI